MSRSQQEIINLIVNGFKKASSKQAHTKAILNQIFSEYAVDFSKFLTHVPDDFTDEYLSYLLYCIYYQELHFSNLPKERTSYYLEKFLFKLLFEVIDAQSGQPILANLPPQHQLELIVDCLIYPREGAWHILNSFEEYYKFNLEWLSLIQLLRKGYYHPLECEHLIQQNPHILTLTSHLETAAVNQITHIQYLLPKLVEAIIVSPQKSFNDLEKLRPAPLPAHVKAENLKKIQAAVANLEQLFQPYMEQTYTLAQLTLFFKTFGLHGYHLRSPITNKGSATLLEILASMLVTFQNPTALPFNHINTFVMFVEKLLQQLDAYFSQPDLYLKGLNNLVYSLPTRSDLSQLPWLCCVLKGVTAVLGHAGELHRLSEFPILIFDQNQPEFVAANHAYCEHLIKEYGASVLHFSMQQIIALSKKFGVSAWIRPDVQGYLGYGSARNCSFFLAPIVHAAFKKGFKTFDELMKMPGELVERIMNASILRLEGQDTVINMGEDDVAMPISYFFGDALFAETHKRDYFQRNAFCMGRATLHINGEVDLESYVKNPPSLYASTSWQDAPVIGAMKGRITKPRFCFPLPFGNEENHVSSLLSPLDFFQQPIQHLAGPRFPSKRYPMSPLDGVNEYLKSFIPYSMQVCMSSFLIDASNKYQQCILPWNDPRLRLEEAFKNFSQLWKYASSPQTHEELMKRFWTNLEKVFDENKNQKVFLHQIMHKLAQPDLTLEAPQELLNLYFEISKDAQLFLEFGKMALKLHREGKKQVEKIAKHTLEKLHEIHLQDYPIAHGLYLLIDCLDSFGGWPLQSWEAIP